MGPDMEDKYRVPLFDGSGFSNWKFRMEVYLEEEDLLQCTRNEIEDYEELIIVDTDSQEIKKQKEQRMRSFLRSWRKCKSILIQRIHDSQLEIVKDLKTAKQIWDSLLKIYERKSISSRLMIRKKLILMKFREGDDLQQHFLEFEKTVRDLKSTGAKVDEDDAVCQLLITLPKSFNSVVTALETLDVEKLTMVFVKSRLLDFQTKVNMCEGKSFESFEKSSTFVAKSKKYKIRCYNCGKEGHKKSNCPVNGGKNNEAKNKKAYLAAGNDGSDDDECLAFNSSSEDVSELVWILDSGATNHMTNAEGCFFKKNC